MSDDVQSIVRMANQIAEAFKASPPAEAADSAASHIRLFWAPRMRQQLIDHAASHPSDLLPATIAAVEVLKNKSLAPQD